jgi:K+-transporting ATPase ATPase C chain
VASSTPTLPIPLKIRQLANGSRIRQGSKVVGSELIGQDFTSDGFHGGASATNTPDPKDPTKTVDAPYNAANSGGSNPTNKALIDRAKGDADKRKTGNPSAQPPVDLVTTPGGALDPHITSGAAYVRVPRVAKASSLPQDRVRELFDEYVKGRTLGLLGESRVNVLGLNLALDRRAAKEHE